MPATVARYPKHGVNLPMWPAGADTRLDAPRKFLDDMLEELFARGERIFADRNLSAAGRLSAMTKLRQEVADPVLDDARQRLDGAHFVLEKWAEKYAPPPAPSDLVGELRRREIRDTLAAFEVSDRMLRLEQAINDVDTETLHAVTYAPAVRRDLVPASYAERVRRALLLAGAPDGLAEYDRLEAVIPVFERTLEDARAVVQRATTASESEWAEMRRSRETFARMAGQQAQADAAREARDAERRAEFERTEAARKTAGGSKQQGSGA